MPQDPAADARHHPLHLLDLIDHRAELDGGRPAFLAPDREPLTYRDLRGHIRQVGDELKAMGLGRGDRVAVVLPEGPELAGAVLAVSCAAACAPLNPTYQTAEFRFYLEDLKAKAVILAGGDGVEPAARAAAEAARELGIPVIRLRAESGQPAGIFTLLAEATASPAENRPAASDDIALLLHTSGTTSRPKLVPLTHRNLCTSAHNIGRTLELSPADRCLNVMPLFHIHALVGVMLSSLGAGASVAFPGRFHAASFFDQIKAFAPSWFSATPAILQEIANRAPDHAQTVAAHPLRFIRSASSPLPEALIETLETRFGVPVIECYGMTEAAHQMASNRLPPAVRKPGSVGQAAGPEIAISDESGNFLPPGTNGEIVIRGANVITGYEAGSEVNQAAFTDGWLRTGDLGYLDGEGFLYISGRIKEIVNRGGEKVSPREVEEALAAHPAIAEVGVFAVPHPVLGEDVAAAVVLRSGASASARDIQEFAAARLADFKIPRHIVFAEELPKSATGKLKRTALRDRFPIAVPESAAAAPDREITPPRNDLERKLCEIWSEVLKVAPIGIHDDFFSLGGDSIQAMMIIGRIRAALGIQLSAVTFFGAPTVATIAAAVESGEAGINQGDLAAPIPTGGVDETAPLSFIQQLIYQVLQDPLLAKTAAFNRTAAFRISGPLDQSALEKSVEGIVRRHAILRSTLVARAGEPVLVTAASVPVEVPRVDLSESDPKEHPRLVREHFIEFGDRLFDLERGPLFRFRLLRLGPGDHVLLFVIHYLMFDGWSTDLFVRELAAHYAALADGKTPDLPGLPIQYPDFARWQTRMVQRGAFDDQIAYWRAQLSRELPKVAFDARAWRSPKNTFETRKHVLRLDGALTASLRDLARRHNATLYMVLLAALQILFTRLTGHEDSAVISQSAGRNRGETERLLGSFLNMLLLRCRVDRRRTFRAFLEEVRATTLDAFDHQDVPFALLAKELFPQRSLLYEPLAPVLFAFKNFSIPTLEAAGITLAPLDVDYQTEPFGLIFKAFDQAPELPCVFLYNPVVLEDHQVERIGRCYRSILAQIVADPEVPLARVLTQWQLMATLGPRALLTSLRQAIRRNLF